MSYKESFISMYQDGTLARQEDWIATLTIEEQLEYAAANKRQKQFRQDAVNAGRLVFDDENRSYTWSDEESFHINKQSDPVWRIYWHRWIEEENITFIQTYTKIE